MVDYGDGSVWIFSGPRGFSGGVFQSRELGAAWIQKHKLTGVLTKYPINVGVYDWAIANNLFRPLKEREFSPEFIARFTSASQDHFHFEDGVEC
jgi:hypothetical protein